MVVRILKSCALLPLRAVIYSFGLIDYYLESAADWVIGARALTEYVREGSCRRCGRCCKFLGVEMPRWIVRRPRLVRLIRAWHSVGLNFEFQGQADNLLAYSCRYFREGQGCSIYPFRHRLCRFFPRQRLYGHPALHEDCGFRFVRRDVAKKRSELAKAGRQDFSRVLSGLKSLPGGAINPPRERSV